MREYAWKDLAVGVEQIFLRLVRGRLGILQGCMVTSKTVVSGIIQTQKELGRNPARLDMSGYPEVQHSMPSWCCMCVCVCDCMSSTDLVDNVPHAKDLSAKMHSRRQSTLRKKALHRMRLAQTFCQGSSRRRHPGASRTQTR